MFLRVLCEAAALTRVAMQTLDTRNRHAGWVAQGSVGVDYAPDDRLCNEDDDVSDGADGVYAAVTTLSKATSRASTTDDTSFKWSSTRSGGESPSSFTFAGATLGKDNSVDSGFRTSPTPIHKNLSGCKARLLSAANCCASVVVSKARANVLPIRKPLIASSTSLRREGGSWSSLAAACWDSESIVGGADATASAASPVASALSTSSTSPRWSSSSDSLPARNNRQRRPRLLPSPPSLPAPRCFVASDCFFEVVGRRLGGLGAASPSVLCCKSSSSSSSSRCCCCCCCCCGGGGGCCCCCCCCCRPRIRKKRQQQQALFELSLTSPN